MGLIDWLFSRGGHRSSAGVSAAIRDVLPRATADALLGRSLMPMIELDAYGLARYRQCVELIASQISSSPCEVRRINPTGRGFTVDNSHALYPLFRWTCNADAMTFKQAIKTTLLDALNWGNGYCLIERDSLTANVAQIYPIKPQHVRLGRLGDSSLVYLITGTNADGYVRPHQILHLKGMLHDGYAGKSTIEVNKEAIELASYSQAFGRDYYRKGTNWGGWIEQEIALTDDALVEFSESMKKQKEEQGSHAVPILPPGFKFNPNKVNAAEGQFIETRKYQDLQIAGIFNVPPGILGIIESGDKNIEAQSTNLWKYSLLPWMSELESELEIKLLREKERPLYRIAFCLANILKADETARVRNMSIRRQWGVCSQNDWFAESDQPLIEGGDEYLRPLNMLEDGRTPEPAEPPPNGSKRADGEAREISVSPSGSVPGQPGGETMASPTARPTVGGEGQHPSMLTVETFSPLIAAAVRRLLTKEAAAIESALRKDSQQFEPWADEFYRDLRELAADAFSPLLATMAAGGIQVPAAAAMAETYTTEQRKRLPTDARLVSDWRAAQQPWLETLIANQIKGAK